MERIFRIADNGFMSIDKKPCKIMPINTFTEKTWLDCEWKLKFILLLDPTQGSQWHWSRRDEVVEKAVTAWVKPSHRPKTELRANEITVLGMWHETARSGGFTGVCVWRSNLVDTSLDVSGGHKGLRSFSVQRAGWEFPLVGKALGRQAG